MLCFALLRSLSPNPLSLPLSLRRYFALSMLIFSLLCAPLSAVYLRLASACSTNGAALTAPQKAAKSSRLVLSSLAATAASGLRGANIG